ncbi:MAG: coiled-coil protein [uncultured bacterium]|nr:MAG: coiled-coil protein [uncultured bacterium]
MINDEKTKKVLKIGGIVVSLILIYSLFTLFFGGGMQTKKVSPASLSKNNMNGGYGINSPMMSAESIDSDAVSAGVAQGNRMMKESVATDNFIQTEVDESAQITDKKVIKNGDLSLKIGSADWAANEISNIVKQKGGEVFSTNFYEAVRGQKSGFMTVKVPVAKFEETVSDIKKIAVQVISESTTGQDVTERYTDLQAQLKNKKAEEESFVKILGTAGKIDDVLAATREVARVRGEIERLEGKIRFMDSQTDMSTITINLTEDVTVAPVNEGWRPWQVVKQSVKELVSNIQDFADGIIRFIIVGIPSLIPFILLIVFLIWAGKKLFRKINS